MAAFREYSSAVDALNQVVGEGMGVNRTDHRVLEILSRRGPMTAGELAKASLLTTGAVTAVVDRLERVGYARRVHDTEDRRRVLIEETPECRKTAMGYYGPFMRRSFEVMAKYTADELQVVRDFIRDATELAAGYVEELRADDPADHAESADRESSA